MDNIMTMAAALDAAGIKIRIDDKYRSFEEVMNDLRYKWRELDPNQKQTIANAFVRFMIRDGQ